MKYKCVGSIWVALVEANFCKTTNSFHNCFAKSQKLGKASEIKYWLKSEKIICFKETPDEIVSAINQDVWCLEVYECWDLTAAQTLAFSAAWSTCFCAHVSCFHSSVVSVIFNFWIVSASSFIHIQLTNGFDHHGAQDPHLHPSYFSYSSPTTTTTTSPISSPSCSSVSPTWPWSRSGCGQSGEFLPLSPSGLGVIPSSRVPSWKVWSSFSSMSSSFLWVDLCVIFSSFLMSVHSLKSFSFSSQFNLGSISPDIFVNFIPAYL